MKVYLQLVRYHVSKQKTSLKEAQQMLRDEQTQIQPDMNRVFVLIYSVEQKRILESQLWLSTFLVSVLE